MKDKKELFRKMLRYIRIIDDCVVGLSYEVFIDVDEKVFAASFALCQIAELANRFSENEKSEYPIFPWVQLRAVRNRIIHEYESVNKKMLWDIIVDDLPKLAKSIEDILG